LFQLFLGQVTHQIIQNLLFLFNVNSVVLLLKLFQTGKYSILHLLDAKGLGFGVEFIKSYFINFNEALQQLRILKWHFELGKLSVKHRIVIVIDWPVRIKVVRVNLFVYGNLKVVV